MTDVIPYSFDGHIINGLNVENGVTYKATLEKPYGLPSVNITTSSRPSRWPLVTAVRRESAALTPLAITIEDGNLNMAVTSLHLWFSPEDETPKRFVIRDADSGRPRYIEAICRSLEQVPSTAGRMFVALLAIHDDVRFRAATKDTETWGVTASGQTKVITNQGDDYAFPILTVTPTASKTGGYGYKQWMPVEWVYTGAVVDYPTDIVRAAFNTAALVSGGKMQADGDDLRVYQDGSEIPRWLGNFNTSTTRVWCNLDWQPSQATTLKVPIASGDAALTLDAETDISGFPASGILLINNEAFVYTSKNDSIKRFLGVIRAAKGTTASDHSASDVIKWIQHDLWIVYGNATAINPGYSTANGRPRFNPDVSTNDMWSFEDHWGNDSAYWSSRWVSTVLNQASAGFSDTYAYLRTYDEPGLSNGTVTMKLSHELGISRANFLDVGVYSYNANPSSWIGYIRNPSGNLYTITAPTAGSTEQTQTYDSGTFGTPVPWIDIYHFADDEDTWVYLRDLDVYLNSSNTPNALSSFSEDGNYDLVATITNQETGDAISLTFNMELNQDVVVDTREKTVVYTLDNSSQFQSLVLSSTRRNWLPLQPGTNTLLFEDAGTNALTIGIEFEKRYFF